MKLVSVFSDNWIKKAIKLKPLAEAGVLPELSVDAVESQACAQSFKPVGVESQAVNALKQGLHVGRALLLLRGRGLFDRPLDELLDASPAEVSEGAVGWVNHAILNMS